MKNRILTLIIGILIGAIAATAGFYIYVKYINPTDSVSQSQDMTPPDSSSPDESASQDGENNPSDGEEPPEKPDGEDSNDGEEPPEKPDGESNDDNSQGDSEESQNSQTEVYYETSEAQQVTV